MAASGLDKLMNPSSELAAVVGSEPISRKMAITKLWEYIKANKLQDANDGRIINGDEKLKKVFGQDSIHMMKLAGLLSAHLTPAEEDTSMPMAA